MREILFRGKSLDNGKWESGYLLENQGRTFIYQATNDNGRIAVAAVEIDPDTVAQYTGMKDKNGKKIFEGDVFTVSAYGWVAVVEWDEENARYLGRLTTGNICYVGREPRVEVIGNIHDNADLIKIDEI